MTTNPLELSGLKQFRLEKRISRPVLGYPLDYLDGRRRAGKSVFQSK